VFVITVTKLFQSHTKVLNVSNKRTLKEFVNAVIDIWLGEPLPIKVGEPDFTGLPEAACCLVVNDNGLLLAVSRKDDPTQFGMPGGKVDPGESPLETASRELEEETGLVAISLVPVFSWSDGEYLTHTYLTTVEGEVRTHEKGVVDWVHPDVLLRGPFGTYNRLLLDKIGWNI